MDQNALYQSLSRTNGLSRVTSPDGRTDRLVLNDPWISLNPKFVTASRITFGAAVALAISALVLPPTGLVLGLSTNLVVVAMLLRLAAPGQSGLAIWNGFICLGDTRNFAELHSSEQHLDVSVDGSRTTVAQSELALGYAVWQTAHTSTRNSADTALVALSSYANAYIACSAFNAIWNSLHTPRAFFVPCTALGLLSAAVLIAKGGEEVELHIWLMGPFAFYGSAILYALTSAKWLRWKVTLQGSRLVMQDQSDLNALIDGKVLWGFIASAMVPIHLWLVIALGRRIVGANIGGPPATVQANGPTPIPSFDHLLLAVPFSLISGIIVWSNFGHIISLGVLFAYFIVPACLSILSLLVRPTKEHIRSVLPHELRRPKSP